MIKLINFLEMPYLNQLRYEMHAPFAKNFKIITEVRQQKEENIIQSRLCQEGIDVELKEIQTLNDATLSYKNQRVLVYIRDVNAYRQQIQLPRFHISYCKKLEEMSSMGRWAKYVVSHREDGYFRVCINSNEYQLEKLSVCQHCLQTLSWNDFSIVNTKPDERKKIVLNFSISDFFSKYPKSLFSIAPTHRSNTAPPQMLIQMIGILLVKA